MPARTYQKYQIIRIPSEITKIGKSDYPRPFLIIEISGDSMYVMGISTQIDTFFNQAQDFYIEESENGFETTGLDSTSFVKNQEFRVPTNLQFGVIGYLSGECSSDSKNFQSALIFNTF